MSLHQNHMIKGLSCRQEARLQIISLLLSMVLTYTCAIFKTTKNNKTLHQFCGSLYIKKWARRTSSAGALAACGSTLSSAKYGSISRSERSGTWDVFLALLWACVLAQVEEWAIMHQGGPEFVAWVYVRVSVWFPYHYGCCKWHRLMSDHTDELKLPYVIYIEFHWHLRLPTSLSHSKSRLPSCFTILGGFQGYKGPGSYLSYKMEMCYLCDHCLQR